MRTSKVGIARAVAAFASLFVVCLLPAHADLPSSAPQVGKKVAGRSSQVFTVRYVCFIAEPTYFDFNDYVKSGHKIPAVFDDLQNGSSFVMEPTPLGFLSKLKTAEPSHAFRLLTAGSVVSDSEGKVVIQTNPRLDDPLRFTLLENMALVQNSPATALMRHTGNFAFTPPDLNPEARDVTGWNNAESPSIAFGKAYSQGVLTFPDGRKMVYAFAVFKGNINQVSFLWEKGRTPVAVSSGTKR